jgi:class 3 adenylate cyclase/tetratricopeptide (TPR) repeat protein/ribosomal protein L40E
MRCSRCYAGNPADAKFCGQCGAPLGSTCASCGATNPPENKFCGQCGALLDQGFREPPAQPYVPKPQTSGSRSTLPGEMKQVTVLFCDIVNSTPLTERLGAEGMRELVRAFLDASLAEVQRYGGTAPQFTGDGFMALFGAPLTLEDHVRRALLTALAIQRALRDTGATAAGELYEFQVRIGIHTGPVVFGPVADNLSMDYTVIGDTANVAARLQQVAEPGTILISEAVRSLAEDYARVEPVGLVILKGKAEPIPAYRLLSVSHRRSGLRESPSPRTAIFVDRESELAILNNFLRQVENGHGQAVGLVGEPGIGKSRLLAEFRRQVTDGRATWVEGRCLSYGTAIPYLLALDLLRSSCGIAETDVPDVVVEKVRAGLRDVGMDPDEDGLVLLHLLEIKDVAASPALSNPETVKSKAFETLRQLAIRGSQRRLLILALEDLHWVDKISEEFLGFLAENVRNARVLLLATYRPGYRPPWSDKSYAGQTPLQPLSQDDSAQMVRSVLRGEHLVDLVTQEIVAKADGNPFFLEQLALHAGEVRDLRTDLMVPDTIHDVVMARIDRLPEQTKRLLQIAAVIGREFPLGLLHAVWQDRRALEDQLRDLVRLEFIYERIETEGPIYVFRHALTQETAYGSLLERHRRVYHGVVGHAIEELYSGRADEVTELLALHFGRGNNPEKAVDYAIAAAEKAQRRCAYSEALFYFSDAVRRLGGMPDTHANQLRRLDAVIKQGEVKLALGQHAEHIDALDEVRGIVETTDNARGRVAWHYWRGFLHSLTGGRPKIAIEHCQRAASIASAADFDELDGFVFSCLAQAYIVAGDLRPAVAAGQRALSIFAARGDLWPACRALWHLSSATNYLGQWQASFAYCRRALDLATELDDRRLKTQGLWRASHAHVQQGDVETGLRYCEEALAFQPIPYDSAATRAVRGYGWITAGRIDAGIAELEEVVAWFESSRLAYFCSIATLWLVEGHLAREDVTSALPLVEQVLKTCQTIGYLHFEGLADRLTARCLAAADPSAAAEHVENARRIFEQIGAQNDLAKALATRADLYRRAGDFVMARQLLQQAHEIFVALGTRDEPTRVEAALAALDTGRPIDTPLPGSQASVPSGQ